MLPKEMEDELSEFFFFHPSQSTYKERIREVISRFGRPELFRTGDYISIQVANKEIGQQTFFLLSKKSGMEKLVGVFIFISKESNLVLAHMAANFANDNLEISLILGEILSKAFKRNTPEIIEISYLNLKIKSKLLLE